MEIRGFFMDTLPAGTMLKRRQHVILIADRMAEYRESQGSEHSGEGMFIPYKVDVPMERVPWANWLLMGAPIVISIALFSPLNDWNEAAGGATLLKHAGMTVDVPA